MGDLSGHTLVMAIQAVNNELKRLAQQIEATEDPELSDLEDLILSYSKSAMELKKVYAERQRTSDNLPPYEELVDATPGS